MVTWTLGGTPDLGVVAAALARIEPTVVLLGDTPRRGAALRRLAARSGLVVAARAGRGRAGSAVLVAQDVRVLSTAVLELPGAGRPRAATHAILGLGGSTLQAMAFRLGADRDGRVRDAVAIVAHLDAVPRPAVLGGDLGEAVGDPAARRLLDGRVDCFAAVGAGAGTTYPCPEPSVRHDVLLVDPALVPLHATVPSDPDLGTAATHLPVVVELQEHT